MNTTLTIEQINAIMSVVGWSVAGALFALVLVEVFRWAFRRW